MEVRGAGMKKLALIRWTFNKPEFTKYPACIVWYMLNRRSNNVQLVNHLSSIFLPCFLLYDCIKLIYGRRN